jgi:chromate transporter
VAGVCFILPAALIVCVFAWLYVSFGSRPEAGALLYGVKPVIIAIVIQALYALGRMALKTRPLMILAVVSAVAVLLGAHELAVLFLAGVLSMVLLRKIVSIHLAPLLLLSFGPNVNASFNLSALFLFFLKVGSVLFGSGYVLLAFLRADLVERWHWLTEAQLLDAIAVGQITPGPLFTTATFIGYLLGGGPGAFMATAGIFLPAFLFVAVSGPLIPRIRESAAAGAFLDGVNVASLALMTVVTWELGRTAIVDLLTVALFVASAVMLVRYRVNSGWIVLGGAVVGLLSGGTLD